jgi:NitT/TauT family transport system ATP-binding protein/nitrate/nitrite transport system substrate-binding protein
MTQMIRWGQIREPFNLKALAERVFRTDLYRAAVAGMDMAVPPGDEKREGHGSDGKFFGAETYDPAAPLAYLDTLAIRSSGADLQAFAALNR